MGKKNFIGQLRKYQKRVRDWHNWRKLIKGTEFNKEENTTIKFVVPLLKMLGWNDLDKDMEFEYYIRNKNKKGGRFVDIALYLYDKNPKIPKILIEVKPIQNKIESAATQIFKYYLRNSKVNYGITTNGKELKVFSKRFVTHGSSKARELFSLKLEDFIDYRDVLLTISKKYVETGIFEQLAKEYQTKEYSEWRKPLKTGDPDHDDYKLPLEFARKFLGSFGDTYLN